MMVESCTASELSVARKCFSESGEVKVPVILLDDIFKSRRVKEKQNCKTTYAKSLVLLGVKIIKLCERNESVAAKSGLENKS